MKLIKAIIRPGKVKEILDNGEIKASAPGLFSHIDNTSKLPPIYPWQIGSNCNSFSKPKMDEEVWIINFADNPRQLYWFRKDKISNNKNIDITGENVEILCNKNIEDEWATIYLSDGSGWIISKGESIMQIRKDGTIQLNIGKPNRTIDINEQCISLGSEGKSNHPAVYGDVLVDTLRLLVNILKQLQTTALPNPYTTAIGAVLQTTLPLLESKIPEIVSSNVTLD